MHENEIARIIVDAAFHIHKTLGPGLLERVYLAILAHELQLRGLMVTTEQPMPISYKGVQLDIGFRADLIVEGKLIIELKSIENIHPVHKKQLLTYLKVSHIRLGLLINFGESLFKNGVTRIVNGL